MSELTQSPYEIVKYYGDLLIIQYHGKVKARAQVEAAASALIQPQTSEYTLEASTQPGPAAGYYVLEWNGYQTANINWDAAESTMEDLIHEIPGLEEVTVRGTFYNGSTDLKIKFKLIGVTPVADALTVVANTLTDADGQPVKLTMTETDKVLPLAVQDGFNLTGDDIAVGAQLDILGKYVGVARTGPGFSGQVALNDTDYLSLIKLAVARNSLGSSLADIDTFINAFFPGEILVFDLVNMRMSYMLSTAVGSLDLIQRVVVGNLLPKPMGVGLGVIIYAPVVANFFGFRTYESESPSSTPFNTYEDYHTDWLWLDYTYGLFF